ncbi:hypothetical protein [Bernardetia sp.]|uniref:hypothetical protein n=1 Tax=Bernardetia sp. TaxID=1937974 RepID=UPI0025BBC39D|nr:hypothetical protein [Bernardetia sp.]
MKTKLYTSLFLWLTFIILIVSYSLENQEEELKAIAITKMIVLNTHKEYYDKEINNAEEHINVFRNHPRYRKVQDTIEMGRVLIDSMFENGEIQTEVIMPFLYKSFQDKWNQYALRGLPKLIGKYRGENEILKQIHPVANYQFYYKHLYNHHDLLYGGILCGFNINLVRKSSDTTFALQPTGFPFLHHTKEPICTIQSADDNIQQDYYWKLSYNKNSTEPVIFQVNIYTKTDTIRKRYKIKPPKGRKLKPYDYEEIE